MRTGHTLKNQNGFTLVELVIVIAVIGILSFSLLPLFAQGWQNAQEKDKQQQQAALDAQDLFDQGRYPDWYTRKEFRATLAGAMETLSDRSTEEEIRAQVEAVCSAYGERSKHTGMTHEEILGYFQDAFSLLGLPENADRDSYILELLAACQAGATDPTS